MTDFPHSGLALFDFAPIGAITSVDRGSGMGMHAMAAGINVSTAAVWPVANTAIFMPFYLPETCTIYQAAIEVAVQSGNVDVGVYDEGNNLKVSAGSTAVGAVGVQVFNLTDTVLTPGTYWIAMNCSNTTASFRRQLTNAATARIAGMYQQAVGATALPSTSTPATMAQSYVPMVSLATYSQTM